MSAVTRLLARTLVALGVITMTSCSSPQGTAEAPSLEGTSWVLAELPGQALVTERQATAQFQQDRVQGSDGCNRYSAPFSTTGSTIQIGPRGASTMMACPPDVTCQAEAFMAALTAAKRYRVTDGRLELLGANGAVLAALAAQAQSLAGTTWAVTAINNGRQAVVGLVHDSSVTMSFGADGRVTGSGGCNQYSATYRLEGSSLRLSPAAATRRVCPTEGVMEQEQAFFKAMESVATMRREGDMLEMRTADDALALMLRRSEG